MCESAAEILLGILRERQAASALVLRDQRATFSRQADLLSLKCGLSQNAKFRSFSREDKAEKIPLRPNDADFALPCMPCFYELYPTQDAGYSPANVETGAFRVFSWERECGNDRFAAR